MPPETQTEESTPKTEAPLLTLTQAQLKQIVDTVFEFAEDAEANHMLVLAATMYFQKRIDKNIDSISGKVNVLGFIQITA